MNIKLAIIPVAIAAMVGCTHNQAPDVSGKISDSLKQAGLNTISVTQDRDKGVVKLAGTVNQEADKTRAEQIANPLAQGQVVADEIIVVPDNDTTAKTVQSDTDKAIESNLDAAFTKAHMKGVTHDTKNGVVTLKGDLRTPAARQKAERIASAVPDVQQVVNEIDVRNRRATSTTPANASSADRSADRSKQ